MQPSRVPRTLPCNSELSPDLALRVLSPPPPTLFSREGDSCGGGEYAVRNQPWDVGRWWKARGDSKTQYMCPLRSTVQRLKLLRISRWGVRKLNLKHGAPFWAQGCLRLSRSRPHRLDLPEGPYKGLLPGPDSRPISGVRPWHQNFLNVLLGLRTTIPVRRYCEFGEVTRGGGSWYKIK